MLNEKRYTLNMNLLIQGFIHTIKQIRLEKKHQMIKLPNSNKILTQLPVISAQSKTGSSSYKLKYEARVYTNSVSTLLAQ